MQVISASRRVGCRLHHRHLAVVALLAAACVGGCAGRGYVPPEALNPPAGDFTRAVTVFVQNTQKEHLATYRRDVRRDLFVATVRDVVQTENWNANLVIGEVNKMQSSLFLCLPRYGYTRVARRIGNIEAVGSAVSDRLQAPGDNIGKLLKSLGTSYTIRTDAKQAPPTYNEWQVTEDGKHCLGTVQTGDPFVTRPYVGREIGVAAVPAAIALIEVVWSVVKPVMVGTLQNIDLERRNAAVRAYFADDHNVKALKDDLRDTEVYLNNEFRLIQKRTAGRAAAAAALLFDPYAPHWAKIQEIAGTQPCRSALVILGSGENRTAPRGVTCLDNALAAASGPLDQALNAADAFDVALERQLPEDTARLSAQVDTLRDIALGKQPEEAKVKALWAATLRYVALYETVSDAASAANRKKISDAIDAFLKTLDESSGQ